MERNEFERWIYAILRRSCEWESDSTRRVTCHADCLLNFPRCVSQLSHRHAHLNCPVAFPLLSASYHHLSAFSSFSFLHLLLTILFHLYDTCKMAYVFKRGMCLVTNGDEHGLIVTRNFPRNLVDGCVFLLTRQYAYWVPSDILTCNADEKNAFSSTRYALPMS